jgi:hypothetical protein
MSNYREGYYEPKHAKIEVGKRYQFWHAYERSEPNPEKVVLVTRLGAGPGEHWIECTYGDDPNVRGECWATFGELYPLD